MSTIGPSILAAPSSPCNSSRYGRHRAEWSAGRSSRSRRGHMSRRAWCGEQRLHAFPGERVVSQARFQNDGGRAATRAIQVHPVAVDGVEGAGRRIMRPEDVKAIVL